MCRIVSLEGRDTYGVSSMSCNGGHVACISVFMCLRALVALLWDAQCLRGFKSTGRMCVWLMCTHARAQMIVD